MFSFATSSYDRLSPWPSKMPFIANVRWMVRIKLLNEYILYTSGFTFRMNWSKLAHKKNCAALISIYPIKNQRIAILILFTEFIVCEVCFSFYVIVIAKYFRRFVRFFSLLTRNTVSKVKLCCESFAFVCAMFCHKEWHFERAVVVWWLSKHRSILCTLHPQHKWLTSEVCRKQIYFASLPLDTFDLWKTPTHHTQTFDVFVFFFFAAKAER